MLKCKNFKSIKKHIKLPVIAWEITTKGLRKLRTTSNLIIDTLVREDVEKQLTANSNKKYYSRNITGMAE